MNLIKMHQKVSVSHFYGKCKTLLNKRVVGKVGKLMTLILFSASKAVVSAKHNFSVFSE